MLVMCRRARESIFIGAQKEIEVKVLGSHQYQGEQVYRVGVEAAKAIPIRRDDYTPKAEAATKLSAENDQYTYSGDAA